MRKYRVAPVTATEAMDRACDGEINFAPNIYAAMLAAAPPEGDEVVAEMAEALDDLVGLVRGEAPSLLEDVRGSAWSAALSDRIDAALARFRETFGDER